MKKTATLLLSLFLLSSFLMRTAAAQEEGATAIQQAKQKARASHEPKLPNIQTKADQVRVQVEKAELGGNYLKNDSSDSAPESSVSTTDAQINKSKSKSINSKKTRSPIRKEPIKVTRAFHPVK